MSPHNFYFIYLIHYIYVGLFRPIYFLACQMVSFTPTEMNDVYIFLESLNRD